MIIVIATRLTAITVSCCGTIGWVGLIIPHITKTIIGRDVNKSLPICAIFGAIFTLIADILSRTLVQSEIPISAITGIIGSIIFTLILIYHSKMKYGYSLNYSVCNKKELFNEAHSCQLNVNNKKRIISIDNLGFKYNNQKDYVLKNITFGIYENDIILLYGTNGSWKTTLLKIISGILIPTFGKVVINTNSKIFDLHNMDLIEKSKIISYVKQNFSNVNNILVKDYLLLGMVNELKFYEKLTHDQFDRVYSYADRLNITRLLDKKFSEISGGEKQLVVICQSLLQNTEIMVLDEPTSSLDSDNEKMVMDTLVKLSKEYNKTLIIATHNQNFKNIEGCKIKTLKEGIVFNEG